MVARNPVTVEENPCRMYTVISSAVSEWFLMLLLFFNGFISYVVAKFARYCKLQTPCLFCSRVDHILGSEKPGFLKNLICDAHKVEISSLAYCHVHRRLADIRDMCETCLLSFTCDKKLSVETYRSLVRKMEISPANEEPGVTKLHEIVENDVGKDKAGSEDIQVPKLSGHALDFLRKRHCSCCHRRFRMKSHAHRLLQTTSAGVEIDESSGGTLGLSGCDCPEAGDLVAKRKESRNPHGMEHLSLGYSELKISSDSESEIPPSDEDGRHVRLADAKAHALQPGPAVSDATGETALEKLILPSLVEPNTRIAVDKQVCEIEPSSLATFSSDGVLSHGLEELNWKGVEQHVHPSKYANVSDKSPPNNTKMGMVEIGDVPCVSSGTVEEVPKTLVTAATKLKPLHIKNDSNLHFGDAYNLAIAGKGVEPAPSPRDPCRAQEDLRMLLFQLSSARGLDLPLPESTPSPRICRICEEAKPSDRSGPTCLQSITKRFSLERNESGFSSLDESVFSEIEGESTVDRLKRMIEFERKSLILLYKELEEERSASAIAANQAMAMMTRLQQEKAAMHMEALQYQRMMEEQAEYDQEALQNAHDLLAQKDREIQELEVEIEAYRKRLMDDDKAEGPISEEEKATVRKIYLSLEDEKVYISKSLKNLEKKLRLYSTKGLHAARSEGGEDRKPDAILENGHCTESDQAKGDATQRREGFSTKNPHSKTKEISKPAVVENARDKDIIATVNMVSQLNERLEALEVDRNFLEHTINTLRKGNEGLQFVQEIACYLQDLRKAMPRREQVVT